MCILYNAPAQASSAKAHADVVETAQAVYQALQANDQYRVFLCPVEDRSLSFVQVLQKKRPAVVFNLCESLLDEAQHEPLVPQILEFLNIPYTGHKAHTLMMAFDKIRAKYLMQGGQIATPMFWPVYQKQDLEQAVITYPVIVKPAQEDGSLGINTHAVVFNKTALITQANLLLSQYSSILLEQYIAGREINVPILGGSTTQALACTEIDFSALPKEHMPILSYEAKWQPDSPLYQKTPSRIAQLEPHMTQKLHAIAQRAAKIFDLNAYARLDFRVDMSGKPFLIDINPNCDLSPSGGFFKAVHACGWSYRKMCETIIDIAKQTS